MSHLFEYNRQGENLQDYDLHTQAQINFLRLVKAVQTGNYDGEDADENLLDAAEDIDPDVVDEIVSFYSENPEEYDALPGKAEAKPEPKNAGKTYQQGRKVYSPNKDKRANGDSLFRATKAAQRRVMAALSIPPEQKEKFAKVLVQNPDVLSAIVKKVQQKSSLDGFDSPKPRVGRTQDVPDQGVALSSRKSPSTVGAQYIKPEPRMTQAEKDRMATRNPSANTPAPVKEKPVAYGEGPNSQADLKKLRGNTQKAIYKQLMKLSRLKDNVEDASPVIVEDDMTQAPTQMQVHQPQQGDQKLLFDDIMQEYYGCGEQLGTKRDQMSSIAQVLAKVAENAGMSVHEEASDWFDKHTISRNMKELSSYAKEFEKLSKEADMTHLRMQALYDDMGRVLERYFNVKGHEPVPGTPNSMPTPMPTMESVDFDANAVSMATSILSETALQKFKSLNEETKRQLAWKLVLREGSGKFDHLKGERLIKARQERQRVQGSRPRTTEEPKNYGHDLEGEVGKPQAVIKRATDKRPVKTVDTKR